ncbi:MAG: hypothetical protein MSS98_05790, partial [Alphaproteobacteria bacterium]|nr:hypothetical protein [Alphaproteobacteria bacterium]
MADVLLENTNVFEPKKEYSVAELRKKFEDREQALRKEYAENAASYTRIKSAYDVYAHAEDKASFDYDEKSLTAYKN